MGFFFYIIMINIYDVAKEFDCEIANLSYQTVHVIT